MLRAGCCSCAVTLRSQILVNLAQCEAHSTKLCHEEGELFVTATVNVIEMIAVEVQGATASAEHAKSRTSCDITAECLPTY